MKHEERARWALIEGQRRYMAQRGRKLMGGHQIDVIAETLAAVEREALERAINKCNDIATLAVQQPGRAKRDPALYEQGIGAERCVQALRGLKDD